jgi:hypothetical protein
VSRPAHRRRVVAACHRRAATVSRLDLKVNGALALWMSNLRGLGLAVLEGCTADGAGAFWLLAIAADQLDVANGSVAAQMSRDRKVVHSTDIEFLVHLLR